MDGFEIQRSHDASSDRNLWYQPKVFVAAYPGPKSQVIKKTLADWRKAFDHGCAFAGSRPSIASAKALDST